MPVAVQSPPAYHLFSVKVHLIYQSTAITWTVIFAIYYHALINLSMVWLCNHDITIMQQSHESSQVLNISESILCVSQIRTYVCNQQNTTWQCTHSFAWYKTFIPAAGSWSNGRITQACALTSMFFYRYIFTRPVSKRIIFVRYYMGHLRHSAKILLYTYADNINPFIS